MNKVEFRLKQKYVSEVKPKLAEEFGILNLNAVPRVTKVVVNSGVGKILKSKEMMEQLKKDMAAITGQSPSVRNAKISVASFSVRKGMPVGLQVTLRQGRMYIFLDKLFSIVLPRLRDFRGLTDKSFDMHGNYSLGFEEHTAFPEVDLTKSTPHGIEITIVTTGATKEVSKRLLELLGMPFEKN